MEEKDLYEYCILSSANANKGLVTKRIIYARNKRGFLKFGFSPILEEIDEKKIQKTFSNLIDKKILHVESVSEIDFDLIWNTDKNEKQIYRMTILGDIHLYNLNQKMIQNECF